MSFYLILPSRAVSYNKVGSQLLRKLWISLISIVSDLSKNYLDKEEIKYLEHIISLGTERDTFFDHVRLVLAGKVSKPHNSSKTILVVYCSVQMAAVECSGDDQR